jgi:hypothetical protein
MPWKFDPFKIELVWAEPPETFTELADIDMGDTSSSDIRIDMGDRTVDDSQIDQGLRVYDGDI